MNLFQFIEQHKIKAKEIFSDTLDFLGKRYGQSENNFTYASSWGQILHVIHNHNQTILTYFADAISESNPLQAKRNNSIYGNAALTGHSATRNRTSRGEISIKYIGNEGDVVGDTVYIPNYTRIRCINNGLVYLLDMGQDDIKLDIFDSNPTNIRIIQGEWDFQNFTGTGEDLQTFEVSVPNNKQIDDNEYTITVNGKQATQYDSLLDIPFGVLGYTARTGITSGIDIAFGQSGIHEVPTLGSDIRVDYLTTDGRAGNFDSLSATFEFLDDGFNTNGESVDLNQIFRIKTTIPPVLGANAEPPELTKRLAPMISRFNVIHDKSSLKYWFEKLNFFNVAKIHRLSELTGDNRCINQYSALLIPKLEERLTQGEDYFSTPIQRFLLSRTERTRLLNMLEESGKKSGSISVDIINPTIRRYVANIFVEAYEYVDGIPTNKTRLKERIKAATSEYLLKNDRVTKIPHSDLVKLYDNIKNVDTVKVTFISEQGEQAQDNTGFDEYGNIVVNNNEIAVIRGGWTDRDDITYEDTVNIENDHPGSLNIYIKIIPNGR